MRSYASKLRYALLAAPLALVGLPLYVYLPGLFAQSTGLLLSTIGMVLLMARVLEAIADPWIGRYISRLQTQAPERLRTITHLAAGLLAVCVVLLLQVQHWVMRSPLNTAFALTVCVACAYFAYAWLSITHQTIATALVAQGQPATTLYAARESLALFGVLLGSILPLLLGWLSYAFVTVGLLAAGLWSLQSQWWALIPAAVKTPKFESLSISLTPYSMWQDTFLKRCWWVFLLSSVASGLPATLLGFYVQDVLGLGNLAAPKFLAIYFVGAALGFSIWPKAAQRYGAVRVWALAMGFSAGVFALAFSLNSAVSQVFLWFGAVCASTGFLLGAELILPQSLVAARLAHQGLAAQAGQVFGWWTFAQKSALALAAGVGLWGLSALAYVPQNPSTAQPLVWLYCAIPCALKLLASLLAFTLNQTTSQKE